jgi:hypothetical protein
MNERLGCLKAQFDERSVHPISETTAFLFPYIHTTPMQMGLHGMQPFGELFSYPTFGGSAQALPLRRARLAWTMFLGTKKHKGG